MFNTQVCRRQQLLPRASQPSHVALGALEQPRRAAPVLPRFTSCMPLANLSHGMPHTTLPHTQATGSGAATYFQTTARDSGRQWCRIVNHSCNGVMIGRQQRSATGSVESAPVVSLPQQYTPSPHNTPSCGVPTPHAAGLVCGQGGCSARPPPPPPTRRPATRRKHGAGGPVHQYPVAVAVCWEGRMAPSFLEQGHGSHLGPLRMDGQTIIPAEGPGAPGWLHTTHTHHRCTWLHLGTLHGC
jgi:hypothetical protein